MNLQETQMSSKFFGSKNEKQNSEEQKDSEAMVETCPRNADETTTEATEDDRKVSNSNSEADKDILDANFDVILYK